MEINPATGESDPVLVEVDSRRRVTLGRLGRHPRYLARELADGTLILNPAVVMTEAEAAGLGTQPGRARQNAPDG